MNVTELIESAQFVIDAGGNKKAVLLDFSAWQAMLPLLKHLETLELEEIEDVQVVREIEARIAQGEETMRDWAEFEAELDELSA